MTEAETQGTAIPYARVDGPPSNWCDVEVVDTASGERIARVVEANAVEGWFIQQMTHADGQLLMDGQGHVRTRRITRPITIRTVSPEPAPPPAPAPPLGQP